MSTEVIDFLAEDGVILNGYLNKGKAKTDKVLVEIHGMTSNCFKNRERTIAKRVEQIGIDTICFNNRGSEIIKYIKYKNGKKELAGMAYENFEESYYDIIGAIKCAIKLGYKKIYLQGHSLGATKIVYTYNKIREERNKYLKFVKAVILLSLVDLPGVFRMFSKPEDIEYALKKKRKK